MPRQPARRQRLPQETPTSAPAPAEFRRYRRALGWSILGFISIGSIYLILSVSVTIYRRRHAVPSGEPLSAAVTLDDLDGCNDELADVTHGLDKHLEGFHSLLDHYDADAAQQWSDAGDLWRGQWRALGTRCRFGALHGGKLGPELEAMASVHAEIGETETIYAKDLRRFAQEQAPRLDRIRERIEKISERLDKARENNGDQKP